MSRRKRQQKEQKTLQSLIPKNYNKKGKSQLKFKDYFFHAVPLFSKKKYIGNTYKDYYKDWNSFQKSKEGTWFRYRDANVDKNIGYDIKNLTDEEANTKSQKLGEKGTRIKHNFDVKSWRTLRGLRFKWYLTSILCIIFSVIGYGLVEYFSTGIFQFYADGWFWFTIFMWIGTFYWIYAMRRSYIYYQWVFKDLTINQQDNATEIQDKIMTITKSQKESASNYLGFDTLKHEAGVYKKKSSLFANENDIEKNSLIVDDKQYKTTDENNQKISTIKNSPLRCYLFNPDIIETKSGFRVSNESKIPTVGYAITSWLVSTIPGKNGESEADFVRVNGFVPKNVFENQDKDPYRLQLNSSSNPVSVYEENAINNKNKLEAVLIAAKSHAVLIAPTGKGKTNLFMLPIVIMLMFSKDAPSLFVNSKGDDIQYLYNWSIVCGYNLLNLNYNSISTADRYNPLTWAWVDMYSYIQFTKNEIEVINITPEQYSNSYFFTIRNTTFRYKDNPRNIDFMNKNLAYKMYKTNKKNEYLFTAKEIIYAIMDVTKDYALEQHLLSRLNAKGIADFNKLGMNSAVKFILNEYANGRVDVNYTIGQIRPNYLFPYIDSTNPEKSNKQWFIGQDNEFHTNKEWYLVGGYGFFDREVIEKQGEIIANEWKENAFAKVQSALTDIMVTETKDENNFFEKSGQSLFLSSPYGYLYGMIKYGTELFCVEHFNPKNLVEALKIIDSPGSYLAGLSTSEKKKYEFFLNRLKIVPKGQGDNEQPHSVYVDYETAMSPYGSVFRGVNASVSYTSDTWNGIVGSKEKIVGPLAEDKFFAITCFSTADFISIYYKPTIVLTTAYEGDTKKDAVARIVTDFIGGAYQAVYNTYTYVSRDNMLISPRPLFMILDEFAEGNFSKETTQHILVDGRSRNVYVMIITQTQAQIVQKNGEDFLTVLNANALTFLSLGETDKDEATKTSEKLGTYKGYDMSAIDQVNANKLIRSGANAVDSLTYKQDNLFVRPDELLNTPKGHVYGTIQTSSNYKTFFSFVNTFYFVSELRRRIENDTRITPVRLLANGKTEKVTKPQEVFAPIFKDYRFDFISYIIYTSILPDSDYENEGPTEWTIDRNFNRDWNNVFQPIFTISTNDWDDEGMNSLDNMANEFWKNAYEENQRKAQNNLIRSGSANTYENELTNEDLEIFNVTSLNLKSKDLTDSIKELNWN